MINSVSIKSNIHTYDVKTILHNLIQEVIQILLNVQIDLPLYSMFTHLKTRDDVWLTIEYQVKFWFPFYWTNKKLRALLDLSALKVFIGKKIKFCVWHQQTPMFWSFLGKQTKLIYPFFEYRLIDLNDEYFVIFCSSLTTHTHIINTFYYFFNLLFLFYTVKSLPSTHTYTFCFVLFVNLPHTFWLFKKMNGHQIQNFLFFSLYECFRY